MKRIPSAALAVVVLALAVVAARAQVPSFPAYEKKNGAFATATAPESCTSCHHRDAPAPPDEKVEDEKREVVVVGAGLSGLTAAWKLRDRDVVVLEKDPRAGGKAKSGEWEGVKYSEGPAYFVDYDGDVKQLLDEVELKPVQIPEPVNGYLVDGKLITDPWVTGLEKMPFDAKVRERLSKAFKEIASLADEIAVPARSSPKKLLELDQVPAIEYFSQYGDELVKIVQPYIKSCFAIEAEEVSALGALTFLACEFQPVFSFPNGLGAVPARIAEKLGAEKVRYGAYVTEIAAVKDGVRVVYRDASGKPKAIRARAVVVSIAQNAAKYVIKGLTDERRDLMSRVFHGGYAVASIKTSKRVYDGLYDTWFLDGPVSDLIVADWVARGGKKGDPGAKGLLTAYMPLGVGGRAELLSTPNDVMKQKFLDALAPRIPGLKEALVGVDVYYHGHGMHVAFPGYITEVTPKLQEPIDGRIFFAGVELDLPAFESAVWSGVEAAKAVKATALATKGS